MISYKNTFFVNTALNALGCCGDSGGTYGQLKVYYSTAMVDIVTEATQDGTAIINYFTGPVSGQRNKAGTVVNITTASNRLLVRLLALGETMVIFCVGFSF